MIKVHLAVTIDNKTVWRGKDRKEWGWEFTAENDDEAMKKALDLMKKTVRRRKKAVKYLTACLFCEDGTFLLRFKWSTAEALLSCQDNACWRKYGQDVHD